MTESGEDAMSTDFKAGFQAGVVADLEITENFSIIPELLFGQRGSKLKLSEDGYPATASITLNYLQLPVNFAYKFDVDMGSKLFIFTGPYLGYGLSGKIKTKSNVEGLNLDVPDDDIKFGSGDDELKPIDFGINAGIGYQFERIFFNLQYNHDLSNLNNENSSKTKNMNVAVTAGYLF